MQRLLISAVVSAWFLSAGVASIFGQEADAALARYFKHYLEEAFRRRPMEATRLGDHRFDRRLDDLSPEARAEWIEHTRKTLRELPEQVSYQKLTRGGQIDFEIFRHELEKSLWLAENVRPFEEDPRVYNEYISDSVFLLLTQSSLPRETNIGNSIARMGQIPRIVAAARRNLRNPPRVVTETALRQNRGAIDFYQREIFQVAGDTPQADALRAAAQPVVTCLNQYQQFLERELLPRAAGTWRLGKEKFARKLDLELDAGLSADEVLSSAEAEFARLQRDMFVIARQLWARHFPRRALPPDDVEGRRQTIREVLAAIAVEHGRAEDLTRDARATVDRIKSFIAERGLLRLPEPDRCRVIEMPEFQRGNSTAYMNGAPPLDPDAASVYAVSPPPKDWDARRVQSLLEEYNRYMLQVLTIHEAYPGHYVQLEYANRQPSLVRRVLGSGVYIEGWAVYTEQMMLDQGYGEGDLSLRLTQLKFYLRAVANAILDHKMHCGGFDDDEALRLLTRDAFQSEGEARLKIIRAKQSSCQLSTYFVGRTAMFRTRQAFEHELGPAFDLARFHEAVLEQGSVPVKYLPELLRRRLLAIPHKPEAQARNLSPGETLAGASG
ncbi:MAG: DUF885 domain-containing protein [Thermoguttaceae bacterium]|jgi:uncharacterized protein (DUF885 family)